jgi:hypothetical protein
MKIVINIGGENIAKLPKGETCATSKGAKGDLMASSEKKRAGCIRSVSETVWCRSIVAQQLFRS